MKEHSDEQLVQDMRKAGPRNQWDNTDLLITAVFGSALLYFIICIITDIKYIIFR